VLRLLSCRTETGSTFSGETTQGTVIVCSPVGAFLCSNRTLSHLDSAGLRFHNSEFPHRNMILSPEAFFDLHHTNSRALTNSHSVTHTVTHLKVHSLCHSLKPTQSNPLTSSSSPSTYSRLMRTQACSLVSLRGSLVGSWRWQWVMWTKEWLWK
jgi:hypothetical protein